MGILHLSPLHHCHSPSQFSHTLWQPQLYSSLPNNKEPLPSTRSSSLTLVQRRTDPREGDGTWLPVRMVLPPELPCAPCTLQALLISVSLGSSSTPAWGFSFLCSLLACSHPSSRLCLLYGQQLRTVSFLYSPPWGAAFQMMLLLCSCHTSAEITPLTPSASSPDHSEVTAFALGMSTLCNNALCPGKTAVRELSPLVLLLPKLSPAEVIKALEKVLCEERLRAGTV